MGTTFSSLFAQNRQRPFMEKFTFGSKYDIVVENKYRQGNVLYTFAFSDIQYTDT